jgi:predicted PurR-regulated permease PerM
MRKNLTIKFDIYNLIAITGLLALSYALWSVRGFILMMIVALVISTFINDFVIRLEKHKIPRMLSVMSFYIFVTLLFFAFILFVSPIIVKEVTALSRFYPEISQLVNLDFLINQVNEVVTINDVFLKIKETPIQKLFNILGSFFGGIINLVVVFVVSFYLSIERSGISRILKIFTPQHYEESVNKVWENTQKKIGGWFRAQLIIAVLLIFITYIGLSIIGIPYALLLSLVAGLFGLIPYGIFIAIIPAVIIAGISGGFKLAIVVLLFYLLVQQVLDYGVQPYIFKKMTGIPPLLVILSVIIGTQLFGFAGLIIAIPAALFGLEIISEIEYHKNELTHTE